jgi:hypothetical protein
VVPQAGVVARRRFVSGSSTARPAASSMRAMTTISTRRLALSDFGSLAGSSGWVSAKPVADIRP